jgi:pSer/pThr/pTyr-binding forkhead associated (FHA) protein
MRRNTITIGRDDECDIVIHNDPTVSRQHAQLIMSLDGQLQIKRLSKTNPIFVNSTEVNVAHTLQPNDIIIISEQARLIFIAAAPGGSI